MRKSWLGVMLSVCLLAPSAWAKTYAIDPDHTTVEFKIRHLLSFVRGMFEKVDGQFDYVPDHPEQWKVSATIPATSINTHVDKRDEHLRSKDFFDVAQFPNLTFTGTSVTDATATNAKLQGDLTIHGVTKPVVFDVEIHGVADDPWGNERAAFTATGKINRFDYGLKWNKALEAGSLVVGQDVDLNLAFEGVRKLEAGAPAKAEPKSKPSKAK